MPPRYEVIGVEGLPEFRPGADVAGLVTEAARRQDTPIAADDLLVVSQKIVSKAEGRLVRLSEVTPSPRARAVADEIGRDPHLVEIILRESRRVVRQAKGVLIVETHHGWVCANAGVDQSNVDADTACLLPEDADRSAAVLRERVRALTGHDVGVIIADTFGRPWREGLVNVAIGPSARLTDGGVKIGPRRYFDTSAAASARSAGVKSIRSSTVSPVPS